MMRMSRTRDFTLLEILLVVAAIGILAGIVIVALNPGKQLADTRNAERQSEVTTILNAINQYVIDNNGTLPSEITTTYTEICQTDAGSCTSLVDLSALTTDEEYLVDMPVSPQASTTDGTGYAVKKSANDRVSVKALGAEQDETIEVTR